MQQDRRWWPPGVLAWVVMGVVVGLVVVLAGNMIVDRKEAPVSQEKPEETPVATANGSDELRNGEELRMMFHVVNMEAGLEIGRTMYLEGRTLDEGFVQEAAYRIKGGDPNVWLIRRADVVAVCEVILLTLDVGLERAVDEAFRNWEDGLKSTMLGIIAATDATGAELDHYCANAGL